MLLEYSIYLTEDSCRIMPWISLCSFVYSSGLTPVSYSIQMSKFLAQLSFRIMRDGNLSSVKFRIKDKMRLQNLSNSQYGALVYLQRSILGMRKEIFSESFHFRISCCLPPGEMKRWAISEFGIVEQKWSFRQNMERQPEPTLSVSVFSFTPGLQQAAPTWQFWRKQVVSGNTNSSNLNKALASNTCTALESVVCVALVKSDPASSKAAALSLRNVAVWKRSQGSQRTGIDRGFWWLGGDLSPLVRRR